MGAFGFVFFFFNLNVFKPISAAMFLRYLVLVLTCKTQGAGAWSSQGSFKGLMSHTGFSLGTGSIVEHGIGLGRRPPPPSHHILTKQRSTPKRPRSGKRAPQALTNPGWGPKILWVQVREEAELEGPLWVTPYPNPFPPYHITCRQASKGASLLFQEVHLSQESLSRSCSAWTFSICLHVLNSSGPMGQGRLSLYLFPFFIL